MNVSRFLYSSIGEPRGGCNLEVQQESTTSESRRVNLIGDIRRVHFYQDVQHISKCAIDASVVFLKLAC